MKKFLKIISAIMTQTSDTTTNRAQCFIMAAKVGLNERGKFDLKAAKQIIADKMMSKNKKTGEKFKFVSANERAISRSVRKPASKMKMLNRGRPLRLSFILS